MIDDPIVSEIHKIREDIWRECDRSAQKMGEAQQEHQARYKDRLITVESWKKRRAQQAALEKQR